MSTTALEREQERLKHLVATARFATEDLEKSELHLEAFGRVLDYLLNKEGTQSDSPEDPLPSRARSVSHESPIDEALSTLSQRIDAVADFFDVEPDQVEHLFDVSQDEPALVLHSSKLESAKTPATRQIALLVTGLRTALGLDTTTKHIRSTVDDFSRLDTSNFMGALVNMEGISVLGKKGSPNRAVRMKVIGHDEAQHVAQSLISGA